MADGRSVLTQPNELPDIPDRPQSSFSSGGYAELWLRPNMDHRIICVRGRYQNEFFDEERGVIVKAVEPMKRYRRHRLPIIFQSPMGKKESYSEYTGKHRDLYFPCSAGPDLTKAQRCLGCQIPSRQCEAKDRFVLQVIHLGDYHLVPSKSNAQASYPRLCSLSIGGKECKSCQSNYPKTPAALRYIDFSGMDYKVLKDQSDYLRNQCVCGSPMGTTALVCSICKRELIHYTPDGQLEFRKAMEAGRYYCQSCSMVVATDEMKRCSNPNCEDPAPRSLFNTIFTLRRIQPAGKTFLALQVMDKQPAGDALLLAEKLLQHPLDLDAIFAPSVRDQSRLVRLQDGADQESLGERR